ncbi:CubicO group peptidase (beta-lactamase class C family) [Geomicrobium halophilum]|uniref:CubicO group peptidase (Beta-lactamase class C family) n=1 Tax=Geomicrobium halophilum TaxID=549000 RepID=A0A841PQ08_9BACL|nr:serine hydrolase [Geomicrobium halophilum]MBB6448391.1 CubicO group peptidase (beta-lactamase class C family) [Geomicrobium halophilum]
MGKLKKASAIGFTAAALYTVTQAAKNWNALTLFHEHKRAHHFRHMDQVLPSATIRRAEKPFSFQENISSFTLPDTYSFKGETKRLNNWLADTDTTGFLVIKDDEIISESYFQGSDRTSKFTSWSMAKSVISAMIGIAIAEGRISSIHDPITDYVPELTGSGYENVPIEHALMMASGVHFNENYHQIFSDIKQVFYHILIFNRSIDHYMKKIKSSRPSGERFAYVSMDTQVLGMIIRNVTGMEPSQYLERKIWQEIGTEYDAFWNQDRLGTDLSFCGLNATLRDYAKIGRLYQQKGYWLGKQIIPQYWVEASTTSTAAHLKDNQTLGYQYQWWVPHHENKDFLAIGIWGQYIYVHPDQNTIIVKTSIDADFEDHELETIAVFREITRHLSEQD